MRGGSRPGAGRPRIYGKRVQLSILISEDTKARLKEPGDTSPEAVGWCHRAINQSGTRKEALVCITYCHSPL